MPSPPASASSPSCVARSPSCPRARSPTTARSSTTCGFIDSHRRRVRAAGVPARGRRADRACRAPGAFMPDHTAARRAPLEGVRVLDLTRLLPGPLATQHLADYGADVIKVEDTGAGDYARTMGAMGGDTSWFYQVVNRNKRSLRLDLK